jgi:hypothetical protein
MSTRAEYAGLYSESRVRRRRAAAVQLLGIRLLLDFVLIALVAGTAVVVAFGGSSAVRLITVLVAFCVVPGAAFLGRVPLEDDFVGSLGLAIALSLAAETAVALIMIWTGWWHPRTLAFALGVASCSPVFFDLRACAVLSRRAPIVRPVLRHWRETLSASFAARKGATAASLLPLAGGIVAWSLSIGHINVSSLGDYGLPPALPALWYVSLALLVAGVLVALLLPNPRGLVIGLYAAAFILVFLGTIPAVSRWPEYAWFYKHAGVTRFLELHGHVNTNVDIYQRWPGFFALTALFSTVAGRPNPADYAAWAEAFFTAVDVLLIWAAVRTIVKDVRVIGMAVLLFVIANWVREQYYSPQAMGFVLTLACLVLLLRMVQPYRFVDGRSAALAPRLMPELLPETPRVLSHARLVAHRTLALVARVTAAPPSDRLPSEDPKPLASDYLVISLVLFAVMVPTHQLAPYLLLLQLAAIVVVGMLRPKWALIVMAVVALAYFFPNLEWVRRNYKIFTSFDPFQNAQYSLLWHSKPLAGIRFNGLMSRALAFFVWGGAALAFIRLSRQGLARRALPFALLGIAPFAILFSMSYGGEAGLRVALFSLPWCAALTGWALTTIRSPVRRVVVTVFVVATCAGLFVPAFLGASELYIMPNGEVQASEYFYTHARPHSILVTAAPAFPMRLGANYDLFIQGTDDQSLMWEKRFRHRHLGSADIAAAISFMRQYSSRCYLVFSTTSTRYAEIYGLTPRGALPSLERAVKESPRFRLWYGNREARIYELVAGTTQTPSG